MTMNLTTYDGHAINNGTAYTAIIPDDAPLMAQTNAQAVKRAENWPVYTRKELTGARFPLLIKIHGSGSLDELKKWFDTAQQDPAALVALDGAVSYAIECTPVAMVSQGPAAVRVTLFAPDPVWKAVTPSTSSWTVTASGQTKSLTVGGTADARPVFTITPSGTPGGYAYRRFIKVKNATARAFENYPLELTGGLNTATLVSGGKMQADGDDVRLLIDGVEAPRWLAGMNSASTKIWAVLGLRPEIELILGTAIPSSGTVGEIVFKATTANDAALAKLPDAGILEIDSELFTYSGKSTKTRKVAVTARAAKGTSMAGHSIGATVTWIEHDIWLVYGYASATAPEVDDTRKPIVDLSTSTNTSWVYSEFADAAGLRSGAWKPTVISSTGKLSRTYRGNRGADADPATEAGMEMNVWTKSGRVQGESAALAWLLSVPGGIDTIAATGEKFRGGGSWPATCALQKSADGSTYSNVWNETTPVTALTWTAVNRTAASFGNVRFARFMMSGSLTAATANQAAFEVESVTVALTSSGVPVVSLLGEEVQHWVDMTLTNQTSGDALQFRYPAKASLAIVIDTDTKVLTVNGENAYGALTLNSVRRDWLPLAPGSNVLALTSPAAPGSLAIGISWAERKL